MRDAGPTEPYIDDEWTSVDLCTTIETTDPTVEEVAATVARVEAEDVDAAVDEYTQGKNDSLYRDQ